MNHIKPYNDKEHFDKLLSDQDIIYDIFTDYFDSNESPIYFESFGIVRPSIKIIYDRDYNVAPYSDLITSIYNINESCNNARFWEREILKSKLIIKLSKQIDIFEKIYKLTNCRLHTFFLKDPDNTISTRNHAPNTRFPCSIILEFKKD